MRAAACPIILTYHSISEGRSPIQVSPAVFAEQMRWLKANCAVISLGDVVAALNGAKSLPERAVALTFDDGFRDFYEIAAALLRDLGFPATVFLPTAYCGRTNSWPGQPRWAVEKALLDWHEVAELAQKGLAFGSHSTSHPDLTSLPAAELEQEILESKQVIESRTGHPAEFFCYPYGRWNPVVRALARKNYRGACSTGAGVVEPDADPLALPRVDVHYLRRPGIFRSLFTERLRGYLAARRLVRRVRGQPEGIYARASQ